MKRSLILYAYIGFSLLFGCGSDDSSSDGVTNKQTKFADYVFAYWDDQTSSCTVVYNTIFGNNFDQTTTIVIDGSMESVNYINGTLTGLIINESGPEFTGTKVIYNDGVDVKYLRWGDSVFSSDCNLSSHPSAYSFGVISDGMIKDINNYAKVSSINNTVCESVPNSGNTGDRALYKIADVTVNGTQYKDALIEYWLDIEQPFATLQYNGDLGIPIPSDTETGGDSITDITVFDKTLGKIAYMGVDAATGTINEIQVFFALACGNG